MHCTLASPGEYDGSICVAAAMRAVATFTAAACFSAPRDMCTSQQSAAAAIGVNATADTGNTSPAIFEDEVSFISPAKSVKFLLSHAKGHGN